MKLKIKRIKLKNNYKNKRYRFYKMRNKITIKVLYYKTLKLTQHGNLIYMEAISNFSCTSRK